MDKLEEVKEVQIVEEAREEEEEKIKLNLENQEKPDSIEEYKEGEKSVNPEPVLNQSQHFGGQSES